MIDPFTIALATFGIQKLRGKSTRMALKDAALMGGGAYGLSAFAPGAASSIGIGGAPGSAIGFGTGTATTTGAAKASQLPQLLPSGQIQGTANQIANMKAAGVGGPTQAFVPKPSPSIFSRAGEGIKGLIGQSEKRNPVTGVIEQEGKGFMGLGTGEKIGLGIAGSTLLAGDEEEPTPPFTEADYEKASAEQKERMKGAFERATPQQTAQASPYNYGDTGMYTFNTGGIVNLDTMPKFNTGGINYLPSKVDHDENDSNNYVRAQGYVEDGSGNGDKDEDTILAQLADGEFVSRADAILGAGIIEGANPKSYKDMRRKGAAFFYDQQSKFKRVFDMIDASREKSSKAN